MWLLLVMGDEWYHPNLFDSMSCFFFLRFLSEIQTCIDSAIDKCSLFLPAVSFWTLPSICFTFVTMRFPCCNFGQNHGQTWETPGYLILCSTLDSQRVFKTLIAMGTRNLLNCSDLQENPISNDMFCHCSFAQLGGYEESFCRCSFSLFNVSIYTTVLSESSLHPNTELDFLSIRMHPQHTSALKRALATTLW